MKLQYSIILSILSIIMVMGLASADLELAELANGFKQNSCVDLKQYCSNCSFVNITSLTFPNGSTIALNYATKLVGSDTYVNSSFCNTSQIGSYTYGTLGNPGGVLTNQPVKFEVTPLGTIQTISQGIGGLVPIIIILFLTSLFGLLSYNFSDSPTFKPLSMLFFGLMAIGIVFSLYLAYIYTNNVALLTNTSPTILTFYKVVTALFGIILFVGLVFFSIHVISMWNTDKKEQSLSDGWDFNKF